MGIDSADPNVGVQGRDASRRLEVELKYLVLDPSAAETLLSAPQIGPFEALPALDPIVVEDRYFDTADRRIAAAGYSARLRATAEGIVVGVKGKPREEGPLRRREEVEANATPSLDPSEWPASAARALVLELSASAQLQDLVALRQLRRRRELVAGDTHAELSVDEVEVVADGRVAERFTEVEIELKSGDEALLAELVDGELSGPMFAPSDRSKRERALAVLEDGHAAEPGQDGGSEDADIEGTAAGSPGSALTPGSDGLAAEPPEAAAPPAKSPGVLAGDTLAEAGRKVLRFHLARMTAREKGVRDGDDPEDVHSMRVATRRLRAAWRVFGDAYRADDTRRFRRSLRELAGLLGGVRDVDVMIDNLVAYQAGLPEADQGSLEPLVSAWRRRREESRQVLISHLDSHRYQRFVAEFGEFTQREGAGAAPVSPTQPHRIRDTAPSRIWSAYEQVRGFEPVLRWADVTSLHELRVAAKRLRYTVEFVREALGPEAAGLIAHVVTLQDYLGAMNDAVVAGQICRAFLVDQAGRLSEPEEAAIGRYLAAREAEVARLRRGVGGPWRSVAGLSYRRVLGRVTAAL